MPGSGAAVVIPAGRTIVLDVSPPPLKSIPIEGRLAFDGTGDRNLSADSIIVVGQGARLEIGTAAAPYRKRAALTLTGSNASENIMDMSW
jgi:G8 domain